MGRRRLCLPVKKIMNQICQNRQIAKVITRNNNNHLKHQSDNNKK